MPTFYGLYHPYIHFHDLSWLKLSALYWDGIYRIVPHAIVPEDDDEVKELADSGLIASRHPGMGAYQIEKPFRDMLAARGEGLVRKYGVGIDTAWNKLDRVHPEKMDHALVNDLVHHQLAQVRGEWLGMHPQLANTNPLSA